MTKTITGVLLDADRATAKRVTIPATLDSYYEHLSCTTIDIVSRTIGGKRFDIICDDEGTFREDVRISALDRNYQPMLVGSLFVCQHDGEGGEISLTESEIAHVLRRTRKLPTRQHPEGLVMLTHVGYQSPSKREKSALPFIPAGRLTLPSHIRASPVRTHTNARICTRVGAPRQTALFSENVEKCLDRPRD